MSRSHQSTAEFALDILLANADIDAAVNAAAQAELGREQDGEDDEAWYAVRTRVVDELLDEMKHLNSMGEGS